MENIKLILKSVAIFIMWIIFAAGVGMLIALPSPHGMSAFIYTGIILGFLGGIFHTLLYLIMTVYVKKYISSVFGFVFGMFTGILTFPVSTLILERTIFFPHNSFQFYLLAFLIFTGSFVGWIIAYIFKPYKFHLT